ncbi:MAG: hypothetical protein ACOH2R_20580 [Pseudomonas sp.]
MQLCYFLFQLFDGVRIGAAAVTAAAVVLASVEVLSVVEVLVLAVLAMLSVALLILIIALHPDKEVVNFSSALYETD